MKLSLIVEGHGDVLAAPLLVRRILDRLAPGNTIEVSRPHRCHRSSIANESELLRIVELEAAKVRGELARVLLILDADDDATCVLGPRLVKTVADAWPELRFGAVLASREYESWLLASAESLRGKRGLPLDLDAPADPEVSPRDAKGWLSAQMPEGYSPTIDQPKLTASLDLDRAYERMPSFQKLVRDLARLVDVPLSWNAVAR